MIGALPNTMRTMTRASTFIRPLKYGLQTEKMRTICSDTQKMSWKRHYKPHQKIWQGCNQTTRFAVLLFCFFKTPPHLPCVALYFHLGKFPNCTENFAWKCEKSKRRYVLFLYLWAAFYVYTLKQDAANNQNQRKQGINSDLFFQNQPRQENREERNEIG